MRRRNEKTTKQIEDGELARLRGSHDDRATAQLDPAHLRALLGNDAPPAPPAEAAIGTGTMPRAQVQAPVEPVAVEPVAVEPVPIAAPARRLPWGPLIAVIVAATALVAVLVLR